MAFGESRAPSSVEIGRKLDPGGGGPRRASRRGSIGAALFKAASSSGSSANPEETFPPRRNRGAKPKVVEWTHEASSSEDEATITF